ncbi:MAG TPA: sensor histidine kinase [Chloroflexota bacterium]|nr:sensor histidine kinase [Chloroflexota bacterium]
MPGLNDVGTRAGPIAHGANLAWVAEALVERREEILGRWAQVTTSQPFHLGRRARAVADHIPTLFDAIVELLLRTAPRATLSDSPLQDPAVLDTAREHARMRFDQGLSAGDVVTEFRLLRQEIGRAIRAEVDDDAPTGDVVAAEMLVHDALDGAIALALTALTVHLEELREEFLATTIHDVRQPITTINGNAQMGLRQLARGQPDLAAVAGSLRRVVAESNRMSLLIGTLADASRLTLGRLEPNRVDQVDLGALIGELLERLEPAAAARVQVEASTGTDLSGCWDPDLLERVIANLVSNALKYSPPDQPVQARLTGSLDAVELSVTDHGIGISEDELPRLFSRYGRAGGAVASGVEGHGLGLYLSKGIVEAHGGRIWAESAGAGLGTTVCAVLPRLASPPPD